MTRRFPWLTKLPHLAIAFTTMIGAAVSGQPPIETKSNLFELSAQFRHAAKSAQPSLVLVDAKCDRAECTPKMIPAEHFSDRTAHPGHFQPECRGGGYGTGIIIDKRGYILTCNHVIGHAESVFVTLANGRRLEAREVRSDPLSDLAVLFVPDAAGMLPAKFGNSAQLEKGDWVLSVAHPYGLLDSISAGIVSAVDREIPEVPRAQLIQSDAGSNPGSSGGALLNTRGEVVGVCEGSYGETAGFAGISFAVPANAALDVAGQLIQLGMVRRGYFGCHFEPVTQDIATALGMREATGVIITSVAPRSPASDTIALGDVILAFDGKQLGTSTILSELIEKGDVTRSHEVVINRQGKTLLVKVMLEQLASPGPRSLEIVNYATAANSFVDEELGIELEPISPQQLDSLGYHTKANGLFISRVLSAKPASRSGVCAGMLILAVDRKPIVTLDDYKSAIHKLQKTDRLLILIGSPIGNRHIVVDR
ncbi:putative periplasmic serine endoprotease DegP-like precursor [Anatilimnocola aggregata]|uniref:Putative periplasmic serine endoprotease DegP-like n=1 Tax=Anatilimnocola aggregata TaxID=2528021 RepID=A0A517Y8Z7_9BACT|nr:trypsin-like peptidase domain-containing protein [Anatilimnocola aggregata]QDU26693.1 putative periplasmic serine endoprotease DegP-like precursor [Anatilimnocola aggregata]